jgi:hypothetical protein
MYTHEMRTVNTQRWVSDCYFMANRETEAWGKIEVLQSPENRRDGVFNGYLVRSGFASGQPLRTPLEIRAPNWRVLVHNSPRQKEARRHEALNFKGFPFDTNGVESSVACSLDWSIART